MAASDPDDIHEVDQEFEDSESVMLSACPQPVIVRGTGSVTM